MKPAPTGLSIDRRGPWQWVIPAGALAGIGVLFLFDPSSHAFYPRCWLYLATGWQCPGCGVLRATHALLHGRVMEALHLNPLFVILVPVAGWIMLEWLISGGRSVGRLFGNWKPAWTWWLLGVVVAFGVLRNLL